MPGGARGAINLEWRPLEQNAENGAIIAISLYAVSDTGSAQSCGGVDLVLTWDSSHLELLGRIDPCEQEPCAPNTYDWLQSEFPDDSQLDGLNNDLTDGDAFFQALARLGSKEVAYATPGGLLVAIFQFRILGTGVSFVEMGTSIGSTHTRVFGGLFPGVVVTGTLGSPSRVAVIQCRPPIVMTRGCRYLSITPMFGSEPVAFEVTGAPINPGVACVTRYAQIDGSLGDEPMYLLPVLWQTVILSGEDIHPATNYLVRTDCQNLAPGVFSSPAATATWRWGDIDGDGDVGIDDVTRVIDSTDGVYPPGTSLPQVDIAPCVPDGAVNQMDVDAAVSAIGLLPFPCVEPCETTELSDLTLYLDCMAGPLTPTDAGCDVFDYDGDGDVDVADFSVFELIFATK